MEGRFASPPNHRCVRQALPLLAVSGDNSEALLNQCTIPSYSRKDWQPFPNQTFPRMTAPRTLSAKQLTVLMLALVLIPIGCGVLLYFNSPAVGEPPLPAEVKLSTMWIETEEDSRRLVPCIIVRNKSDSTVSKLSVGLNEQFYSTGNMSLEPDAEVSIPLESFIARNGSVRFPVGNRTIRKITLFAQLGSGARGISEFLVPEPSESKHTDWMEIKE